MKNKRWPMVSIDDAVRLFINRCELFIAHKTPEPLRVLVFFRYFNPEENDRVKSGTGPFARHLSRYYREKREGRIRIEDGKPIYFELWLVDHIEDQELKDKAMYFLSGRYLLDCIDRKKVMRVVMED